MYVSYDTEARATYVQVTEADVAETVQLSDSVMVDLDGAGSSVGVEFLVLPGAITDEMLDLVVTGFPDLVELRDRSAWLLPAG
ncbi:DUF2283 domain-containing protein [Nocardioides ginsengisoli]|uniref:DUF2283 domain-containing protein n=1 Tax=Nocardioides ginsengisoli TaxID=363868 RepID=A0ABW3W6Q4_9ACTN